VNTERPDNDATDAAEGAKAGGEATPRRRRSPVVVASVAVAVLLAGGGGAYLAATTTGGRGGSSTPGGDATPPPLALDGYTEGGGDPGIAVGEPDPNGATYRADGTLPDGPDSAPVYWAKGEVTKDEVARLAKALDVAGTPKLVGEEWKIGPTKDGSGPALQVNRRAPGIWTFSRYGPGSDNLCESTKVCASGTAKKSGTSDKSGTSEQSAGDPVSEAAAKKAAAPVLKAMGQDDAKLDAGQLMGSIRVVNADPEVGGLPTYGWTTGVQVAADGQVVGGNGNLKAPVKGATYPVISAKKTLDLLNDSTPSYGRKGIGGCATPMPLKDRFETPCGASTTLPKTTPKAEPVTVEGAVFGLASHFAQGRQALVPSWLFEVRPKGADDSFTVTHPAVDPQYLTSPAQPSQEPEPSATPSPGTTGPGDEPTAAPTKRDVKVDGYTADGKDLTVTYTGGVCGDYSTSVSETSDKVKVTVTETPWQGKICIMIAKIYHKTVHLDQPLGDREVVGSEGKAIPKEKSDPTLRQ